MALLQVYWEQVEEMGRWAVGAMQWRPFKIVFWQPQWNWDRGWRPFRAQEEAAKLWVREGSRCQESLISIRGCSSTMLGAWLTHKSSRRGPKL